MRAVADRVTLVVSVDETRALKLAVCAAEDVLDSETDRELVADTDAVRLTRALAESLFETILEPLVLTDAVTVRTALGVF